jgi:hypothetical protein
MLASLVFSVGMLGTPLLLPPYLFLLPTAGSAFAIAIALSTEVSDD